MTKKELYNEIVDLVYWDWYTLSKEFNFWDYAINFVWNTIYATVPTHNDTRMFKKICGEHGTETPELSEIWYEDALCLLYHHYPYGHTNGSNVVLVNSDWDILAIQWNKMKHTSTIRVMDVNQKDYIVINNFKKLELKLNMKELQEIKDLLDNL